MLPILRMRTFWIVEQEVIVVPLLKAARAVLRALLGGIPAIAEFRVVAVAAIRARDHHCL
jgi:hypothetical protein